ncbi:hypothetical protein M378DRAFT_43746, partial [Amanita muscaria Koide BX008]
LKQNLKGAYTCPIVAYQHVEQPRQLTTSEKMSLEHYIAWRKSNGTELAYKLHAQVLQKATKTEVLSLYAVKRLAMKLSRLKALKFDICPNSCMAYTGGSATMTACNFEKKSVICNEPRYNKKGMPRAQMIYVSCLDMIRAMYANAETSTLLRSRDNMLKRALHLLNQSTDIIRTYSDFGDSAVQQHLYSNLQIFRDPHDIALALSTDGAQLTMKKQSNTWVAILIILNLPAEIRYKTSNTMVPFIVPGPQSPGNLESFI